VAHRMCRYGLWPTKGLTARVARRGHRRQGSATPYRADTGGALFVRDGRLARFMLTRKLRSVVTL
jgi:hypothetical protein